MKRLFIHLGMHKTGSTAIQHFLTNNQGSLEENGIHYLQSARGMRDGVSHAKLGYSFAKIVNDKNNPQLTPTNGRSITSQHVAIITRNLEDIYNEIAESSYTNYIISHEGLFPLFIDDLTVQKDDLSLSYMNWLRKLAEICEINYIVYLRRQDLWVESLYAQYQKGGAPLRLLPFEDFVIKIKNSGVLDYAQVVTNLRKLPGTHHIFVRPFESQQLRKKDVVTDFMAILGLLDLSGFVRGESDNSQNFPRPYTILLHQAALAGVDREFREAVELISHRNRTKVDLPKYFLSGQERAELVREYQVPNRTVAQRYLSEDELFFDTPNSSEDPYWTPPSTPEPEFWFGVVYEALAHAQRAESNALKASIAALADSVAQQNALLNALLGRSSSEP